MPAIWCCDAAHKAMWERACSRKRWISQHICLLILRIREQARSHISSCVACPASPIGTTTHSTSHSSPGSHASA
ncbi:hypothetical protein DXV65_06640 [Pseudomonas fluorescens]|nr:hypothetical protein DXV65_06640 [Pseudomonas fluorescens]